MQFKIVSPIILLLFSCVTLWAGEATVEFSADTLTTVPQQDPQHGKIFVGDGRLRTEFEANGKTMIQIIDMKQQTAYMLIPEQKSYMQRQAAPGDLSSGSAATKDSSPCAGMQNITCKKLGVEVVNGRSAEKWEFSSPGQEESGKMISWLDQERRIPIRQTLPDGTTMEMRLLGKETVNGRNTEKWEMNVTRPGGESHVSYQWYDPQIKMNIREEQPGGYVNELVNVSVGAQPAELFAVPPGYKEISIPQGGDSAQGQTP